jgi:hypothetical protein
MKFYSNIKIILSAIIEKKIPVIFASRYLFVYNSTVMVGLGTLYESNVKSIDNYSYKYDYKKLFEKLTFDKDFINQFIVYLCILSMQILNNNIKSKVIKKYIEEMNNEMANDKKYNKFVSKNKDFLNLVYEDVNYYYNQRNKDGWRKSNKQIHLDNSYYIKVNLPIDSSQMADQEQWCPLKGQLMLGSRWGKVKSPIDCRNSFNISKLNEYLSKKFKKINIKSEAKKVLEISLNLTPEQKAVAEFWAGIGGSVTPPGFFNMFLYGYFVSNSTDNLTQIEYFYKLNSGLFQASIVCWNAKYQHLQCRPIQSIRINYPNIPINYYFGKTTTDLWIPYQESKLYTPPFPDYISGHSTFSSTASTILTELLGEDLNKLNITLTKEEYIMLSPIFKKMKSETMNITEIIIPQESSLIINNTPDKEIKLKFVTWKSMAESAGISRIYGGIHYPSSNKIALKVGEYIGNKVIYQT